MDILNIEKESFNLPDELKKQLDAILVNNLYHIYCPFDKLLEELPTPWKDGPIKAYTTIEMLSVRYAELIDVCEKVHEAVCEKIGAQIEFRHAPFMCPEKYELYKTIICSLFGEAKSCFQFAMRVKCRVLSYEKAAERYIERQKQERRAKKKEEALLASIEDEDYTSTSDTPDDTAPTDSETIAPHADESTTRSEDDGPTDVKKQTIIARGTALYMLIKMLQKAGIMPGDNEIDGTVIGRFIATIIGEDLSKGIRYTTTYRKVINKLDEVSNKAKTDAKEYLKPLKIKGD